jgi:hypothetical protein
MAPPRSILRKKGSSKDMDDSTHKLQRHNSLSSEDGRSAFAKARSVSQNTEQEEGYTRDLLTRGVSDIKKQISVREIKFADNVEVNEIARLQESAIDFCFYSEDDLSNFRYEAFMENCGLDPAEFD